MADAPDAVRHARGLVAVERGLAAAWLLAYRRLRQQLLDALLPRGPAGARAALPAAVAEARGAAQRALGLALAETAAQGEALARAELAALGVADPGLALARAEGARRLLAESQAARALGWLDGAAGLLLAEAVRLELAGADAALAAPRLLAPGLAADGRASVWRQGLGGLALAATEAVFAADNAGRGAIYRAAQPAGQRYRRQAIAAIDARTTECCRRVNGQVVGLDEPFALTGTPRFADRMLNPPFHHYCRTVTVLYRPAAERVGPTTEELRDR